MDIMRDMKYCVVCTYVKLPSILVHMFFFLHESFFVRNEIFFVRFWCFVLFAGVVVKLSCHIIHSAKRALGCTWYLHSFRNDGHLDGLERRGVPR